MRNRVVVCAAAAALALVVSAAAAGAQTYDSVGNRAQGMGGAFVAVADDATATWWNPAGLAGGSYFSAVLEAGRTDDPRRPPAGDPAWRGDTRALAVAYPALGLSYYRLRVSEIQQSSPTAAPGGDRQDQGPAVVRLRSLLLQQFGATVGQSLGEHLVFASTLKLLRGGVGVDVRPAGAASLGAAADLEGDAETRANLDLGLMATFGRMKVGAAVRNVREVTFAKGANEVVLPRQARAGVSYTTLSGGRADGVTFAFDGDLTRTATVLGDVRRVAGGLEGWMFSRRLGLRGGVSANTVGAARAAVSGGISAALRSGFYVDAALTGGTDSTRRGWQLGARVTF